MQAILIAPKLTDECNIHICDGDCSQYESILRSDQRHSTSKRSDDVASNETIVVSSIERLTELKNASNELDISSAFIACDQPEQLLYESKSVHVKKHELARSAFQLKSTIDIKFTMVTITIVFRGEFVGSEYFPGDISIAFNQKSAEAGINDDVSSINAISKSNEVSHCEVVEMQSNSKCQLGIACIRFGCKGTTINDGLYEVIVTARESTSFSTAIHGSFAIAASTRIKSELTSVIRNEREASQSIQCVSKMEPSIRILQRKFTLEKDLLNQAKAKCDECELRIEELDLQLDERDEMEDGGAFLLRRMQVLEEEYKHWRLVLDCRLVGLPSFHY